MRLDVNALITNIYRRKIKRLILICSPSVTEWMYRVVTLQCVRILFKVNPSNRAQISLFSCLDMLLRKPFLRSKDSTVLLEIDYVFFPATY